MDDKSWSETLNRQIAARNTCSMEVVRYLVESHTAIRGQLTSAQSAALRVPHLEDEIKALKNLNADLQRSGSGVRSISELELEKKVSELEKNLSKALQDRADLFQLRYERQNMDQQLALALRRNDELEQTQAELKERIASQEASLSLVHRENEALRQQRLESDAKFQKTEEENVRMYREIMQCKEREVELRNEMQTLEEFCMRLKQGLPAEQAQNSSPSSASASSPSEVRFSTSGAAAFSGGSSTVPTTVVHGQPDAHNAECYSVTVVESGRSIWTGGNDRVIRCWDPNLNPGVTINNQSAPLCLDSMGDRLVSGCPDGLCRVWDLTTNRSCGTLTGHSDKIHAVYFGPTRNQVVSTSADRTIRVWDVDHVETKLTQLCPSNCYDLSLADERLCTAHFDGTIRVWDLRTRTSVAEVKTHDGKAVTCVRWSQDRNRVVSLGRDNMIRTTDARMWQVVSPTLSSEKFSVSSNMARLGLSPDDRYVACGSSTGALFIWSVAANAAGPVRILPDQHKGQLLQAMWFPDGRSVVSIGQDRRLCIWK